MTVGQIVALVLVVLLIIVILHVSGLI